MSLTQEDLQQIKLLLTEQSQELKAHTTEAVDALARDILKPSFEQIEQRLDGIETILVEDRLPAVEEELKRLKTFRETLQKSKTAAT